MAHQGEGPSGRQGENPGPLGTALKAAGAPAKPPAQTVEGAEGAEGPTVERAGGDPNAAGVRYLLAGAHAWHAQAEAAAPEMTAVSTGLWMALLASGHRSRWTPWRPKLAMSPPSPRRT